MNFNVYLKKNVGENVLRIAKSLHRSRNAIVNEALEEWLEKHAKSQWPEDFFNFNAIEEVPDFQSLRAELKDNISKDPLA